MINKEDAEKILKANNQEHILKDFDSLSDKKRLNF